MRPSLSDIIRTFISLPLILFLFTIAQNEYLFAPLAVKIGVAAVAAGGIIHRLVRKTKSHTPFWMIVFLCVYNAPMVVGGYVYLARAAFIYALTIFALFFFITRKNHTTVRMGAGIAAVCIFGILSLHFHRNLDFDETLGRCAKEEKKLDRAIEVIHAAKHPYDFTSVESGDESESGKGEAIVAAYGLEDRLRVFDALTGKLKKEISVPRQGEAQRLLGEKNSRFVYAMPWGRRGLREEVLRINIDSGSMLDPWPVNYNYSMGSNSYEQVNGCRNAFEIIEDNGDAYVLCEVSHSLVKINTQKKTPVAELKLPGRDAYDMVFDPAKRRIFTTDYWSSDVVVIDIDGFKFEKRIRVGFSTFGIVQSGRKIFVARPLASQVVEIDADSLTVVRGIEVGYGVRDLEVDEKRGLLFAGNYFDGTVDAVDMKGGVRIGRIFIGQLVRGLGLGAGGRFLYCASGCGVKRIDLDKWLKEIKIR